MIMAIEGLDGSGKTTVALALAKMLKVPYISVPPPEMRLTTDNVLEKHDSLARYLHYLAGVAALIECADGKELVVADRFIASAHALHIHVRGSIAESLRRLAFPCPELSVYLHVSEHERRARLAQRGTPLDPFERKLNDDDGFRLEVARRLQACPGTHFIDTTGLEPEAVTKLARDVWRTERRWRHSEPGGERW